MKIPNCWCGSFEKNNWTNDFWFKWFRNGSIISLRDRPNNKAYFLLFKLNLFVFSVFNSLFLLLLSLENEDLGTNQIWRKFPLSPGVGERDKEGSLATAHSWRKWILWPGLPTDATTVSWSSDEWDQCCQTQFLESSNVVRLQCKNNDRYITYCVIQPSSRFPIGLIKIKQFSLMNMLIPIESSTHNLMATLEILFPVKAMFLLVTNLSTIHADIF